MPGAAFAARQKCGGLPSAAHRFRDRAQLYRGFDARCAAKTRFFGAACVTNHVLCELASGQLAASCSADCCDWLSALGAVLERNNVCIAADIEAGRLAGPQLDRRIVSMEQSLVGEVLRSAGNSSTLPASRVAQIDALLNRRRWLASLHFNPAVRWYSRVLAAVREELAVPIEFAVQAHREAIGMALIAALRRPGGAVAC